MSESFDDIIREFIDFVNIQVGVYMDAMGGFERHRVRVERQIHRVNRPKKISRGKSGEDVVVWASYEDPSKPDIIHNRIIRATEYIKANSEFGVNYQQHSQAILVFIFTYWEDEIRPRLASSISVAISKINSNIMGDLRVLRNVILHSKGVLRKEKRRSLKKLKNMFEADQPVMISYDTMHRIFVLIKQDCARMMFKWLDVENPLVNPGNITDFGIQKICKFQELKSE